MRVSIKMSSTQFISIKILTTARDMKNKNKIISNAENLEAQKSNFFKQQKEPRSLENVFFTEKLYFFASLSLTLTQKHACLFSCY